MHRSFVLAVVLFAAFLIDAGTPAHAYLDPGTGSMMLQALIGAIVGGLVAGKLYWVKMREFVFKPKSETPSDETGEGQDP